MIGQANFVWFVFISLLMHVILLTQYESKENHRLDNLIYEKSTKSNKMVRISFLSPEVIEKKERKKSSPKKYEKVKTSGIKNKKVVREHPVNKVTGKVKKEEPIKSKQPEFKPKRFELEKNLYLKKIINAIEKNKYYPVLARRRNIQDVVAVSFNLVGSGEVKDLVINGNHKVLRHAARSAILDTLPFSEPPPDVNLPLKIKYSMAFSLE